MIDRINPTQLFDGTVFSMSQASHITAAGLVFISGQVAWDRQGTVQGQTHVEQAQVALENLRTALDAAGSNVEQLVQLRIYLRGECADVSAELAAPLIAFLNGTRPSMTLIGVASLATPDTLVEIEAIATVNAR
ncbi:MAG: RidA family protein [Myxococcota bacterium]